MSIEVKCSGCGQLLRVQDQNAGKQARCPKCQTVFTIPAPGSTGATPTFGGVEPKLVPSAPQEQTPFGQQGQNPFADKSATASQNPHASPQAAFPQGSGPGYRQAHRGGQILTFGILGLLCCGLFGIAAWVMGNEDLKKMDAGIMDPAGRGTTQAGRIIGIICVVLMVISVFANIALMAVGGL